MARASAARKSEAPKKTEKEKSVNKIKYMCDVCGTVVYMDMFGNYDEEDLMCCGELMTEKQD